MPILDVEIVSEAAPADGLVQAIADAAGEVLEAPPGETWVRLRQIEPGHYAESGGAPPDLEPVLVTIVMGRHPEADQLAELATRLTEAVAEVTGRPSENVHLIFEPDGIGRVAFGGTLAR